MKSVILLVLLVLVANFTIGQKAKSKITWVNGMVLNADRDPIKKAVIYLDSMKTKIKTNKKGQFKIGLKPDNKVISAYSWNYGIETVLYTGSEELVIVFPEDKKFTSAEQLADMGFKTKGKVRTRKEPKDYSEYLNMYQLIATEVPGAIVNGTTIRLRGNAVNSVDAGQEPLFIVDGAIVGSLEFIFPREVASVRVIRDESASFYGVRGANGVIVIEMKK